MSTRLHIQGEYPADWNEIGDRVRAEAGHRCIRCQHPFRTGAHGKGQWSPCDERCVHTGPYAIFDGDEIVPIMDGPTAGTLVAGQPGRRVCAEWRILTVHHFDGNKANCEWWNCLSLCQRCHLQIQTRVNPEIPYFLEHSSWIRPYVAGYYANKYEGRLITREEATTRLDELLAYERIA